MQTRRGLCYEYSSQTSTASGGCCRDEVVLLGKKRRRNDRCTTCNESVVVKSEVCGGSKRRRRTPAGEVMGGCDSDEGDLFDVLPDDIVISIFCKLSSTASSPSDIANALVTCKRFRRLVRNPLVLSKASAGSLAVSANKWSESAHRFLKECADVGNLEACYILGMIRFYCLQNRGTGASLMARAAIGSHAAALYSLAIIQFNGSGGSKNDKDLRAGVALCARAAFLGHIDAIRELGHCLQDGYGVRQNVAEGRRFLVQANARELASVLSSSDKTKSLLYHRYGVANGIGCPLLSDFGCPVPSPEIHPANRFLVDWFSGTAVAGEKLDDEAASLRLCSHSSCGRPETRKHEFRRCSVCGAVNYCSRACQALDWKIRHKGECAPMERWLHDIDGGIAAAGIVEINGAAGIVEINGAAGVAAAYDV